MAVTNVASTLVVTGSGDQTIPGPLDISAVVVPSGSVVISKGGTTLFTLTAGTYNLEVRSTTGLTVNGACTLVLRLPTYSGSHTTTTSSIVEDSTHRFATDAEKATWNGKQDALGYTPLNSANNLSDVSSKALARSNLNIDAVTLINNTNYTVLLTDKHIMQTGTMSAVRTITLPLTSTFTGDGKEIIIGDESGTVSATNYISIVTQGSDRFNDGTSSLLIKSPGGIRTLIVDKTNGKYNYDRASVRTANNLSDLASAVTARSNLGVDKRTTVNNADYTILSTDKYVAQIGTLSAPRTFTLPAANSVNPGYEIIVADESGTVTSTNMITVQRAGADTINAATSVTIATANADRRFFSDGTSKWFSDRGLLRVANSLSDVASLPLARANIGLDKRTAVNNADYSILTTDRYVAQTGTMSASRTFTLPAANTVNAGQEIIVEDESGTATATNTIVIARSGSDTIDGATSEIISAAYGMRRLFSDGTSKWSFDKGVLRASNNLSDVSSATTSRTNLGLSASPGGWKQIAVSNVAINNTGNTTENQVLSFNIPAGTVGANATVACMALTSQNNNANGKTIKIKFNGTTLMSNNVTTSVSTKSWFSFSNRNSLSSQIAAPLAAGSSTAFGSSTAGVVFTAAVDFSSAVTMTVTLQCPSSAGDNIQIESFCVMVIDS